MLQRKNILKYLCKKKDKCVNLFLLISYFPTARYFCAYFIVHKQLFKKKGQMCVALYESIRI